MEKKQRLIDADALCNLERTMPSGKKVEVNFIPVSMIKNAPTIDAVPVRHGRWYRDPTNENYFCCSVCDGANGLWHKFAACTYKFCPWCGAKMDGGAEE